MGPRPFAESAKAEPLAVRKPAIDLAAMAPWIATVEDRTVPGPAALTVVVVAYCEDRSLRALVTEILAQRADVAGVQVIVVDNGLSPGVVTWLASQPITYVRSRDNLGPSLGRNIGAAVARADLLAFVDADAGLGAGYLAACVAAMLAPEIWAVRGKVVSRGSRSFGPPAHYDLGPTPGPALISTEGVSVWRRAQFVAAGGFEAALYGAEGPVLCYRLATLFAAPAEAFRYDPRIVLLHDYADSLPQLLRKLYRNADVARAVAAQYPELLSYQQAQRQRQPRGRTDPRLTAISLAVKQLHRAVSWVRPRLPSAKARA